MDKADPSKGESQDVAYSHTTTHTHDTQSTSADAARQATHAEKSGKGEEHVRGLSRGPHQPARPS